MKLRTQVDHYLDRQFAWRIQEIDTIKKLCRSRRDIREQTVIRAGVALLYAHWEGFVKTSARGLLNYVLSQRKTYVELRHCYVAHGLRGKLNTVTNSGSHIARTEAVKFIRENLNSRARFSWSDVINTKANLSSKVFANIAEAIGLDKTKYELRYTFIDIELLKRRNQIAHGERAGTELEPDQFCALADEVIQLLRLVKADVQNIATLGSYLAHP
jgi:hypothetical protein